MGWRVAIRTTFDVSCTECGFSCDLHENAETAQVCARTHDIHCPSDKDDLSHEGKVRAFIREFIATHSP